MVLATLPLGPDANVVRDLGVSTPHMLLPNVLSMRRRIGGWLHDGGCWRCELVA